MAADKLIDSAKETACRTAEANAIREKTGSNAAINYDFTNNKGFADAIAAIPTGGDITTEALTVTENGTYTAPSGKAYTPVTVSVSGGSGKNIQYIASMTKISNNGTYTRAGGRITVAKTGTYTCYWVAFANTTGSAATCASCLYKGTSMVSGSEKAAPAYNATSVVFSVSGVSLNQWQTIEVRANSLTGSPTYFTIAGHLIIEEE